MIDRFLVDFIINGEVYASRNLSHLPSIGHEIFFSRLSPKKFIVDDICWILNPQDKCYGKVLIYLVDKEENSP